MKKHDREFFCKYTSASAALAILDTLTVRWSSPRLFNDPFDLQTNLRFDFSRPQLHEVLIVEAERLVFGEEEPPGTPNHPFSLLLSAFWKQRYAMPREEFRRTLAAWLATQPERRLVLGACNLIWQADLATYKVFCVAEEPDDLLMWAHYSKSHTGVVIRLRCLQEHDTALCGAERVSYQDALPVIADMQTWVRRITGQESGSIGLKVINEYFFTKSNHWAYEKEWRVLAKRDYASGPGFVSLALYPEEVDALYLGCRMSKGVAGKILKRIRNSLGHVRVYQARTSTSKFALEFEQIK